MKLATTLGDLKAYANTPAETVRLFEGTGFKLLDFDFYSMNHPDSILMQDDWMRYIEDAANEAAKLGFRFVQAHSPSGSFFKKGEAYDTYIKTTCRSIEACKFLGIENIVVHSVFATGNGPHLGRQGFMEANKQFYSEFIPTMEKTDVNVLIENSSETNMGMPVDTAPGQSEGLFYYAEDMLELLDYMNHPLLHVCWDVGHAAMRDMDQYAALTTLGDQLRALHIQDNFGKTDDHIAPLQGVLNMDEIMCGLIDSGYKGYFTFEASNIIRRTNIWPIYRREWTRETRLANPPVELMRKGIGLLYEIGKTILSAYDVYEY